MVTAADKARQRAEARRLRILARSAERLDVVNGLVPASSPHVASNSVAVTPNPKVASSALDGATVAAGVLVDAAPVAAAAADPAAGDAVAETKPSTAPAPAAAAPVAKTLATSSASAGSRRMAASRRRRYQSKGKAKEGTKEDEAAASSDVKKDGKAEVEKDANDAKESQAEKEEVEKETAEDGKVEQSDKAAGSESEPATEEAKDSTPPTDQKTEAKPESSVTSAPVVADKYAKENVTPVVAATASVEEKKDGEEAQPKPKKYMGVARMRRKILKEQKAQRLRDIADSEVLQSESTSPVLERELAAEMATMGVTASMVREGGVVVDESRASIGRFVTMKRGGLRKRWFMAFVPPMRLVPRLATLLLLFFAGLDLGTQPHRGGGGGVSDVGGMASRDLSGAGAGAGNLVQHVEASLTKPWEYGIGGKVAFIVGAAPSSPPTALPTSFNDAGMVCAAAEGDGAMEECLADYEKGVKWDPKAAKVNHKKDKGGKRWGGIKVQLREDELDSSRARPRGVSHDDEFDDTVPTMGKANNVDPLFQVDLDALLENAHLPFPIDLAAKCAIGFHRTWVYYLWTLPVSLMKSMVNAPKNVLKGWAANPPWILGVTLLLRFAAMVLAGNGKPLSLESEKESSSGDGGGSKNLDVMEKVMETAKNYATSMFPRTTLVLGTLLKVMKVDMYVVLCGMLIGLTGPLVGQDFLAWSGSGARGEWWRSRPVLGDGEL